MESEGADKPAQGRLEIGPQVANLPHNYVYSELNQRRNRMPDPIFLVPIVIVVFYMLSSIKILAEYERAVVFRLGRVLPAPKGPGVILVFRPVDRMVRVSLRVETLDVPAQDLVTRDNVTVKVNAVLFFRVIDPKRAILEVTNF